MKLKKAVLGIAISIAAMVMFNSCTVFINLFKYADLTFKNDLYEIDRGYEYSTYVRDINLRDGNSYNVIQYYNTRRISTGESVVFYDVECNKNLYFTFELFFQDRWWKVSTTEFTISSDSEFSVYDCIYYENYTTYRSAAAEPCVSVKIGDQILTCTATPIEE